MGVSTDAILFFGYCWDEEGEPFADLIEKEKEASGLEDDYDLDDFILLKYGFREPPEKEYGADPSKKEEWAAYFKDKHEFLGKIGIEIIRHCHCDVTMYGIASSKYEASRGNPESVEHLFTGNRDELDEFCKKLGVEIPEGGPKWWLVSYADY